MDYPALPLPAVSKGIPPGTQKKKVVYVFEILWCPVSLHTYQYQFTLIL